VRFIIEQLHLTDPSGKPIPYTSPKVFHSADGEDTERVLLEFVETDGARIVGDVSLFPGYHGVATARKGDEVYTLHVYPGSDRLSIK
jgi:hypothetical protein